MKDREPRPGEAVPPKRLAPPALPTQRVILPNGARRHVVWCPWCESQHAHGDHEGHRAPHCADYSGRSPLACTGYEMNVVAETMRGSNARAFPSDRGFVFLRAFHRSIGVSATSLRLALIGAIFAKKGRSSATVYKSADLRAVVMGAQWNIRYGTDDSYVEGRDLLSLIAELFAIPGGVAAVRVLEATTGAELDAQAALEVSAAIDNWCARGAPRNDGRRR
jgi:hypothetical protein